MKRLLAYLIVVLGLGLTFNVNAEAETIVKLVFKGQYVCLEGDTNCGQFSSGPVSFHKWKSRKSSFNENGLCMSPEFGTVFYLHTIDNCDHYEKTYSIKYYKLTNLKDNIFRINGYTGKIAINKFADPTGLGEGSSVVKIAKAEPSQTQKVTKKNDVKFNFCKYSNGHVTYSIDYKSNKGNGCIDGSKKVTLNDFIYRQLVEGLNPDGSLSTSLGTSLNLQKLFSFVRAYKDYGLDESLIAQVASTEERFYVFKEAIEKNGHKLNKTLLVKKEPSQMQKWTIENIRELEKAIHNQNESESVLFNLYKNYKFTLNDLKYAPRDYVKFEGPKGRALLYQSILHAIDKNPTFANDIIVINSFYLKKAFEREGLENAFVFELSKILKKAYPVQNYEIFYKNNIEPKIIQIAKAEPRQTQKVVEKKSDWRKQMQIEEINNKKYLDKTISFCVNKNNNSSQVWSGQRPVFVSREGCFDNKKIDEFAYVDLLVKWALTNSNSVGFDEGGSVHIDMARTLKKEFIKNNIDTIYLEQRILADFPNSYNTKLALDDIDQTKTTITKIEPTVKPKKKVKVAKVEDSAQEEFKPKKTNQDNEAPVIEIAEAITVDSQAYTLKGKVKDKSQIYLTINGRQVDVKKGKFELDRFSIDPDVEEELKIVAIDQWNNKSEKIVKVTIDLQSTDIAKVYEELKPNNVKVKTDKNKIAIIIGIEKYENLTNLDAKYANRDAKAFRAYATRALGIKPSNIKILIDDKANRGNTLEAFKIWLPKIAGKGGKDIHIFFAGHGLASDNGKDLYILPQDGNAKLLDDTAITRVELISLIQKVNPKSVTMFFDTCYSGQTRDERMLVASLLRPIQIISEEQDTPDNFTIFSASDYDQVSGGIEEAKHGMFSYYLMKGLEGYADENKDKKITNGELIAYLKDNVSQEAFTQNRQQDPMLVGDSNKVLISYK